MHETNHVSFTWKLSDMASFLFWKCVVIFSVSKCFHVWETYATKDMKPAFKAFTNAIIN